MVRNDKEGRESLTEDLTLPLVLAFRDACEALQAEVAFIVTHLHQAERRYLDLEEEKLVTGGDGYFLHCGFGLLYLDEILCRQLKPFPPLEGRDTLPAPHGLLVFAGKGTKRWL